MAKGSYAVDGSDLVWSPGPRSKAGPVRVTAGMVADQVEARALRDGDLLERFAKWAYDSAVRVAVQVVRAGRGDRGWRSTADPDYATRRQALSEWYQAHLAAELRERGWEVEWGPDIRAVPPEPPATEWPMPLEPWGGER